MPSLFEIGTNWVLENKIFKYFGNLFRYFVILSPWKRAGTLCKQIWILITQECIGFTFGWLWSNGSWDEDENVKNLPTDRRIERRTDATDNRRSEKFTLTFSLISWAKKWKKISLDFSFFNHKGNRKIEIAKNHLF